MRTKIKELKATRTIQDGLLVVLHRQITQFEEIVEKKDELWKKLDEQHTEISNNFNGLLKEARELGEQHKMLDDAFYTSNREILELHEAIAERNQHISVLKSVQRKSLRSSKGKGILLSQLSSSLADMEEKTELLKAEVERMQNKKESLASMLATVESSHEAKQREHLQTRLKLIECKDRVKELEEQLAKQ